MLWCDKVFLERILLLLLLMVDYLCSMTETEDFLFQLMTVIASIASFIVAMPPSDFIIANGILLLLPVLHVVLMDFSFKVLMIKDRRDGEKVYSFKLRKLNFISIY